jgi:uncharacterized protein (UPF0332 family)
VIYKDTKEDLVKQNLIKACPVDWKTINNLIKRTHDDLKTAMRNLPDDPECAYNYAYNAMMRSGLALMLSYGFRPEIKDKHLTIVKFTSSILGEKFNRVMNDYDFMRRKRHHFIYEPDIPCSMHEAENAISTAKSFVTAINDLIKKQNPQISFDF